MTTQNLKVVQVLSNIIINHVATVWQQLDRLLWHLAGLV
jgi:hypothetical protein